MHTVSIAIPVIIQTLKIRMKVIQIDWYTLIDGGPLECESSAKTDELFSSTTITS